MTQSTPTANSAPIAVLVHGAFADGSSWAGVVAALQAAGVRVQAPANPLRGLATDALYLASLVTQIPGPVVLVGHSYGGAVISTAAVHAANVVGLVYVCAFIQDEGETLQELAAQATDSTLGPALRPVQYATGEAGATGTELSVDPASFPAIFAADLPAEQAAVLAASQRPVSATVFGEVSGPIAWKTLPSWAIVSPTDLAVGAGIERTMAERAKATIVEIDGSHLLMISHAQEVADVILTALAAIG
jgi:pimeloyl-ACP methyl ester carboxylesterase